MEGNQLDSSLQATLQRGWGLSLDHAIATRILRLSRDGLLPPINIEGSVTKAHLAQILLLGEAARAQRVIMLIHADLIAPLRSASGKLVHTPEGSRAYAHLRDLSERFITSPQFRRAIVNDLLLATVYAHPPLDLGKPRHHKKGRSNWDWERNVWGRLPRRSTSAYDPASGHGWVWSSSRTLSVSHDVHSLPAWLYFAGEHLPFHELVEANFYLLDRGLIRGGRATEMGDECIEDFAGSVSTYLRYRRWTKEQREIAMTGPKYDFRNAHFTNAQVGDHNTQASAQITPRTGSPLIVTAQDLADLIAVLRNCDNDEAIPLAAEVLELKKAAATNSGQLSAAKVEEARHAGLWDRVRGVIGDVAGSAIGSVLKGLLGGG